MENFPAERGSYALLLRVAETHIHQVGRLGAARFQPGFYFYLGRAWGPGGLRARLNRHLQGTGALHWHVDYLRSFARITKICFLTEPSLRKNSQHPDQARLECIWSQALANLPGAAFAIPGFGASDCRAGCTAHLVRFDLEPGLLQQHLAHSAGVPAHCIQVFTNRAWGSEVK